MHLLKPVGENSSFPLQVYDVCWQSLAFLGLEMCCSNLYLSPLLCSLSTDGLPFVCLCPNFFLFLRTLTIGLRTHPISERPHPNYICNEPNSKCGTFSGRGVSTYLFQGHSSINSSNAISENKVLI